MLLIVLGAGASYDSVDLAANTPPEPLYRPPLASELFGDRKSFNGFAISIPYAQNIILQLRSAAAAGRDVERELERLSARPPADLRQKELLALRFYVDDAIRHCSDNWVRDDWTNYRQMAYGLQAWQAEDESSDRDVMIVTFNYDRLLERGCEGVFGSTYGSFGDYTNSHRLQIIKLHGSIDWCRATKSAIRFAGQATLEAFINVQGIELEDSLRAGFEGGLKLVDMQPTFSDETIARVLVPAIAVPVRSKIEYECPSSQVDLMESRLREATKVLIVGWRGGEDRFLASLAANLPKHVPILAVTREHGLAALRDNLVGAGVCEAGDIQPNLGGFSEFMRSDGLEPFLRS